MRNLLEIVASEADIEIRIKNVFQQMFGQDSSDRIYFESTDEAYIVDTGNDDVRTEGMSYGMMIAVQMDNQKMFERLWTWVKKHMSASSNSENSGYFVWSVSRDGVPNDNGPAPDGEEFFATSLLLAEKRWRIKEYGDAARQLLHDMVHKGEKIGTGYPMFEPKNKYIRFIPSMQITDPSYHLPHFYELYAECGNIEDKEFFLTAALESRRFLIKSADSKTGLTPEYADYEGKSYDLNGHWTFFSDSYRVVANIGLDWAWSNVDEGQRMIALHCQKFFERYIEEERTAGVPVFKIDGSPLTVSDQNEQHFPPLRVHHPVGLFATLAQASLATIDLDKSLATKWLEAFWVLQVRKGKYRYYDNLLYFFALLSLSGQYRKEW